MQKEGIEEQLRIAYKVRDAGIDISDIDLDPIFERAQEIARMPGINRADVAESLVAVEYFMTQALRDGLSLDEYLADMRAPLTELIEALLTDKSIATDAESVELIMKNAFNHATEGALFVDALMAAIHTREEMAHSVAPVDGLIDTKTDQVMSREDEPGTLH